MLKLIIPVAIAALFVHQAAQAQESAAGVNERQHRQMERIGEGARSGDLTRNETRRLTNEQREIRREESAARSDGVVTPRERADLHRDLDRSSDHIGRERNDAQTRPDAYSGHDGLSINEREARQREAIRRGVASGDLTRREADRLRSEQHRIERMEQRARADGNFTPQERARIDRRLDNSARHIRHEMNDRQQAGRRDAGWHRGHGNGNHYGQRPNHGGHGNHVGQRPNHGGQQFGHRPSHSQHFGQHRGYTQHAAFQGPRHGRR
jgi:uncharacterized membrane protein YebE (DUF533 family)